MPTDVDAIEGRLADFQRHVEVGFAQTKGQLDILLQRADQQDKSWSDNQRRMEHEFARRDEERLRDQRIQEKQAVDHELRLRRLEIRVYMVAGAAITLGELVAHFLR